MDKSDARALALYFRKFATLLNCGVNLIRSLELVGASTPPGPLRDATSALRQRVSAGTTLSAAMADYPELFGPVAWSLTRAGEVGGVLDETLARLARHLEAEDELRERLALRTELARLRGETPEPVDLDRLLHAPDSRWRQALFCRSLGIMLGSGVPILAALEAASTAFEPDDAERLRASVRCLGPGKPFAGTLAGAGLLEPIVLELLDVGADIGNLDILIERWADVLEAEVRAEVG